MSTTTALTALSSVVSNTATPTSTPTFFSSQFAHGYPSAPSAASPHAYASASPSPSPSASASGTVTANASAPVAPPPRWASAYAQGWYASSSAPPTPPQPRAHVKFAADYCNAFPSCVAIGTAPSPSLSLAHSYSQLEGTDNHNHNHNHHTQQLQQSPQSHSYLSTTNSLPRRPIPSQPPPPQAQPPPTQSRPLQSVTVTPRSSRNWTPPSPYFKARMDKAREKARAKYEANHPAPATPSTERSACPASKKNRKRPRGSRSKTEQKKSSSKSATICRDKMTFYIEILECDLAKAECDAEEDREMLKKTALAISRDSERIMELQAVLEKKRQMMCVSQQQVDEEKVQQQEQQQQQQQQQQQTWGQEESQLAQLPVGSTAGADETLRLALFENMFPDITSNVGGSDWEQNAIDPSWFSSGRQTL